MAVSILNKKLLNGNFVRIYQQVRSGYIVLLPEVDPSQVDKNALFKSGFPDVENFTADNCISSLGNALLDFEREVRDVGEKIIEKKDDLDVFDSVVEPLEDKSIRMDSIWGLAKAIYLTDSSKMPPESYLSVHERARKARSAKFNSRIIYNSFKKCDASKCTEEEQRLISKYITEGKLNGLELGSSQKEAFVNASFKLNAEKDEFRRRIQASSSEFSHTIYDPNITRDFPEDLLKEMAPSPEEYLLGPWKSTLKPTVVKRFLEFCPDRNMRWNSWLAERQVASQHTEISVELSNRITLERIRALRRDIARILGFESFAHMSMLTKMAGSLESVRSTLDYLLTSFQPVMQKQLIELEEFAQDRGFQGTIELWDVPFWARKHRTFLYHWDDVEMKDFFPLDRVFSGLLKVTGATFGLRFEKNEKHQAWHPDIKLYNIYDGESKRPVAGLYVDLHSRSGKAFVPNGLVAEIRPTCRALGPSPSLAALIFNFSPPQDGKPTLLEFNQVEDLFKKFGQALQTLLSSVNYSDVSGTSNIEWDAVDVVSNFMSHWATEPSVLKEISGHYSSNEDLPVDTLDKSRKHLMALKMVEEIYLSNLDLELHTSKEYWFSIMKKTWENHFSFQLAPNDTHPLSFTDSICGQWSAAYFSKIWAKMLAADAFNTFVSESKDPSSDVGSRFRDTFLVFGGSVHPAEVFRRFQGRDPTPEAFVKYVTS